MTDTISTSTAAPGQPDGQRPAEPPPAVAPAHPRGRVARVFLGGQDDPRWARPALWALLVASGVLYLWNLSASGYANDFYAAAVKSGTQSWKALLFGSLDSANSITVDKPPASIWVMALSGRLLGFSSFSMLLPQALMGVGTVALVYATVKRWSGHGAGLVAGALLALTPVAALMFRFNNPDALLVLLMTLGAYFTVRAIESPRGRTALRWLLLAGVAIGFAFLTKMLQGLLVLPAFGLAYLVAAQSKLWTRIWHLLAAAGAVIVSAGWFIALVALWPADSRPYIGGSTDNSLWELAIGYNGLGRIFGGSGNGGGSAAAAGPGGGGGFGGATGIGRMFGTEFGSEISWLIPAALIGLVAGFWFTRRFPRTDKTRAALVLWGGWMLVTMLVFSFMEGTIHQYYTVALAPAVAAVVAVAGRELWRGRSSTLVRGVLAAMIAATGIWSFVLLGRDASWLPWLRWVVLVGSILGAGLLAASVARLRRLAVVGLLVGSLTAMGGTAAYTVATAATPHTGSIPTSGPAGSGGGFGGAGGMGGFGGRRDGTGGTGQGGIPDDLAEALESGQLPAGVAGAMESGELPTGAVAGGTGGTPGGSSSANSELVALLNATSTRWSAATLGSNSAATYILSTDTAVMAIGGFTGSDPSPTLAQFQQYVADGEITYFISGGGFGGAAGGTGGTGGAAPTGGSTGGTGSTATTDGGTAGSAARGGFGGPGGSGASGSEISTWVTANFASTTVGGVTVYNLTQPLNG